LLVLESLGAGGAEVATLNLSRRLVSRGHSCELAFLWGPDTLAPQFEEAGVGVRQLDLSHRWRVDQGIRRLTAAIRDFDPTVIHAQLFFAGLYTALTRSRTRSALRVVTYQNLGYESYPAVSAWHRVRKRIDSQAMRRGIDRHVAVSKAVASHYAAHLGVRIDQVIPNGIEARRLAETVAQPREAVLSDLGLPEDAATILCPARFVHEKGHRYLVDALDSLRRDGREPVVLLAGDGPLRAEIEAVIERRDLATHVRLLGSIEHDRVLELMRACDLVVLPSTHEGFPLAIAEAAAVGSAIVGTSVGGVPDLIEDGASGWLVAPGDPVQLSAALQDALSSEELRYARGSEAQRRCLDVCDIDAVTERYQELYGSTSRAAAPNT
jgi:glycosyltransferase involved in cell wall biosynthesis